LLLNTGNATGDGTTTPFQTPINLPGGDGFTLAIVAADVNNDGFIDLIIGNGGQVNQLLLNTGDATGDGTTTPFLTPINLPGGEMYTTAIIAEDVNEDGFIDLIIGNWKLESGESVASQYWQCHWRWDHHSFPNTNQSARRRDENK
jgi:hypothetical protein